MADRESETTIRYLTPADRIIERGRGCRNCLHFDHDGDATKKLWAETKAGFLSQVFSIAHNQADVAGFIAKADRWSGDPSAITIESTDAADEQKVKTLIKMVDRMDRSIGAAAVRTCLIGGAAERGGVFLEAAYLCDKWNGRTGSSIATAGHKLDKLPDELREDKK